MQFKKIEIELSEYMLADICGIKLWGTEMLVHISVLILSGMLTTMEKLILMTGRQINLEDGQILQ